MQASDDTEKTLSDSQEVLADTDHYKITFQKAVKSDDEWGESVKFVFEFENKSDVALALMSANDASVDGVMSDDLAGFENPDVAAGKTGTIVLDFNSQWLDESINQEFPKFEDNMEITLQILDEDWSVWENGEDIPFSISF